MSLDGIKGNDN